MTYKLFIPSTSLVKTAQSTLQMLAMIASFVAIIAALAGALYILIWLCGVLTLFIHAFAGVCHTAFIVTGSSPLSEFVGFVLLMLIVIKIACLMFPVLPAFFRLQGVRV